MVHRARSRAPANRPSSTSRGRFGPSPSWPPWPSPGLAARSPSPTGAPARAAGGQETARAAQATTAITARRIGELPDRLGEAFRIALSEADIGRNLAGQLDAHDQGEEGGAFQQGGDDDHG